MKDFFKVFKSFLIMFSVIFTLSSATVSVSYANTGAGGATADDGISQALCKVIEKLVGPIGKGIATVAIIFLCFMLFVGKISWGVAIATAIGVAAIPAAPYLVLFLSGASGSGLAAFCGTGTPAPASSSSQQ
ncbi:MAG: TrbC/VirB2 family protein [Alphaproteobacteria bacterium]|nr:TrbC/VirB2 family protein [Alphaproteobacteria bacterium]OJV15365.1 MAG: hypothetical protein BGO27_02535 [Alphaproteobacteria bacterium 33-17]